MEYKSENEKNPKVLGHEVLDPKVLGHEVLDPKVQTMTFVNVGNPHYITEFYSMAINPRTGIVATGCRVRGYYKLYRGKYTYVNKSMDNRVYLWLNGMLQDRLDSPHSSKVISIAFTKDGNVMVTGCLDTWLRVWTCNPESISEYHYRSCYKTMGDIRILLPLSDGNFLLVNDAYKEVTTWGFKNCVESLSERLPPSNILKIEPVVTIGRKNYESSLPVLSSSIVDVEVYVSGDGHRFIALISRAGTLEIWEESCPDPESESPSIFQCVGIVRFPIMGKIGEINCAKLHPMKPIAIIGTRSGCQIMQIRNDEGTWLSSILDIPKPISIKVMSVSFGTSVMSVCLDDNTNRFAIATSSETPPTILHIPRSSEIKIYSFSHYLGTYKHIKTLCFEMEHILSMRFESNQIVCVTRTGSFSKADIE